LTHGRIAGVAGGALCGALAMALPAFFLTSAAAGAKEPSTPAPKGLCTAMDKTAGAGEAFVQHPSAVRANRATLAALTATNVLAGNAPAIASTEASYMEMWVQDVVALHGYDEAAVADENPPELQRKAAVALEKVDADVTRTCPGDAKAFTVLTTQEKATPRP
jgi:hypothetical protein